MVMMMSKIRVYKCKCHDRQYTVCPVCQCQYCPIHWASCPRCAEIARVDGTQLAAKRGSAALRARTIDRLLLARALPMLIQLGDFIANGPIDESRPGSLGGRCDLIGDIREYLKAESIDNDFRAHNPTSIAPLMATMTQRPAVELPTQPAEPMAYRVRFALDDLASFEECNGESRPLTEAEYAENQYMRLVDAAGPADGPRVPVTYAEYLAYYGNPDRHVYVQLIVQRQCNACDSWSTVGSLGSIDLMDDDPALREVEIGDSGRRATYYAPAEVQAWGAHYLKDCAIEELQNAGWTAAQP